MRVVFYDCSMRAAVRGTAQNDAFARLMAMLERDDVGLGARAVVRRPMDAYPSEYASGYGVNPVKADRDRSSTHHHKAMRAFGCSMKRVVTLKI